MKFIKTILFTIVLFVFETVVLAAEPEGNLFQKCKTGDDVSCTSLRKKCEQKANPSAVACGLYGGYRFFYRNDDSAYEKYISKACKLDKKYCGTKEDFLNLRRIETAKTECPNSTKYKDCIPLESACDQKDINACRTIAFHWLNKNENDAGIPYLEKACSFGHQDSCEKSIVFKNISENKKHLSEKQKDLEDEYQRRQIAVEEQKARTDAVNAFSNSVNMWNQQQNPLQPKQQRCRTVVRPGNEYHGTIATSETVCD